MQGLVLAHQEAKLLEQAVVSSRRSTELSMLQYEEGFIDYQRVLDSTRSLTQRQDQYAHIQGQIADLVIAVYKAFGGGWEIRSNQEIISQQNRGEMEARSDWGELLDTSVETEFP
jgi:outer membrane protein TolC